MALGALMGYGLLLGFAFGVRTVLQWRATGDFGWRVAPSPAAWVGDALFTLGAAAAVVGTARALGNGLDPIGALDHVAVQALGAALLAGGAVIALVAQAQMGASWRAGIETTGDDVLVRDGLFRWVRNPFYVGMILATGGVALMVPNIFTVGGWVALLVGCEIDVRFVEEPILVSNHEGYREYAARTGRFVPRVGRGVR